MSLALLCPILDMFEYNNIIIIAVVRQSSWTATFTVTNGDKWNFHFIIYFRGEYQKPKINRRSECGSEIRPKTAEASEIYTNVVVARAGSAAGRQCAHTHVHLFSISRDSSSHCYHVSVSAGNVLRFLNKINIQCARELWNWSGVEESGVGGAPLSIEL